MQDYWLGMDFLKKIIQMDSVTTKQKPDFSVSSGDLLSIKFEIILCFILTVINRFLSF